MGSPLPVHRTNRRPTRRPAPPYRRRRFLLPRRAGVGPLSPFAIWAMHWFWLQNWPVEAYLPQSSVLPQLSEIVPHCAFARVHVVGTQGTLASFVAASSLASEPPPSFAPASFPPSLGCPASWPPASGPPASIAPTPHMPATPPPPHVWEPEQVPQEMVLPQLSAPEPQLAPLAHLLFEVQPHVPGNAAAAARLVAGAGAAGDGVAAVVGAGAAVGTASAFVVRGAAARSWDAAAAARLGSGAGAAGGTVLPQLSAPEPQLAPLAHLFEVQPHVPGTPPPPHVWEPEQVPQPIVCPQLSAPVPQLAPLAHVLFDVQPQVPGTPLPPHVFGAVHASRDSTAGPPRRTGSCCRCRRSRRWSTSYTLTAAFRGRRALDAKPTFDVRRVGLAPWLRPRIRPLPPPPGCCPRRCTCGTQRRRRSRRSEGAPSS